jgi:Lrp/AsnC family leucine-responsive transcriptional regulator
MSESLDDIDRHLLQFLQVDARATLAEMSAHIHLSVSQTQRRLKRLEASGVVRGYAALLDRGQLDHGVMAFVDVVLRSQENDSADSFHDAIDRIPEVLECHRVSGDADYLLKVVATDLQGYSRLAQGKILAIPEVDRLQSRIVFESSKNDTALPV